MKYLLLIATIIPHGIIAWCWSYYTGPIGLGLMVIHWFPFNGCFISHIERWIHIKLIGESCYPDTWSTCWVKKQFKNEKDN